jgi:tetratricopeptide (TPR) repeat protein
MSLKALSIATFIAGGLRDEQLLQQIEQSTPAPVIPTPALKAAQLTIRAGAAFYARELERGERDAIEAHEILRSLNAANAHAASLKIGLSVFRIAAGDYAAALEHLQTAIQLGRKLGNDAVLNRASTNAALSCLRLGQYEQAIEMARNVRANADPALAGVAIFAEAFSLALLNKPKDALARLASTADLDVRIQHPWARQDWYFLQADVLWFCGRKVRALELALLATSENMSTPLARGTTGRFFRWALRPEVRRRKSGFETSLVAEALDQRTQLDALDRFELLASLSANPVATIAWSPALADEYSDLATRLPSATVNLVETLTATQSGGRRS